MKIFFSYPYRDAALAREVRDVLLAYGFEVLSADDVRPGDSLSESIGRGLDSADAFVVLLTRHSAKSQWTLLEFGAALASGKPVIPILADNDAEVPLILRDRVYLDIRDASRRSAILERLGDIVAFDRGSRTQASSRGLHAIAEASAALELERERYERDAGRRYQVLTRMQILAAIVAIIAVIAGLATSAISDQATVAAAVGGLSAVLSGAVGFHFGSEQERELRRD